MVHYESFGIQSVPVENYIRKVRDDVLIFVESLLFEDPVLAGSRVSGALDLDW